LEESRIGRDQLQGSFVTYSATLLAILLIPYLYNNMVRKTFKTRGVSTDNSKKTKKR
jgi:hypothetical protein